METLWNDILTWPTVVKRFREVGVTQVQVKSLSKNHNNRNQISGLGTDLAALSHLFPGPVSLRSSTSKRAQEGSLIYHTSLPWIWLTYEGIAPAPETKLAYYPQHKELRLSGFLDSSPRSPRELLSFGTGPGQRGQEDGRWLIFGPGNHRQVYALIVSRYSPAASYLEQFKDPRGKLVSMSIRADSASSKDVLFAELLRIHQKDWVSSYRLRRDGSTSVCSGTNCHGVTLESELGIIGNGRAAPDYLDWEVKGHKVAHLERHLSSNITLLTPNPDGGKAYELGSDWLTRTYGKPAAGGNRWDLVGVHRHGQIHSSTGLVFGMSGFDANAREITGDGYLYLYDPRSDEQLGTWSFAKLLTHWQTKHAKTVFVPCIDNEIIRKVDASLPKQFSYGTKVHVGEGTDFLRFLAAVANQTVVLDPGLKSELMPNGRWQPKTRFQFRSTLTKAATLYRSFAKETVTTL